MRVQQPSDSTIYSYDKMLAIAKMGMSKDEEPFDSEVSLPQSQSGLATAGKPKYFNRMMLGKSSSSSLIIRISSLAFKVSGFDWNLYNKTHYDPENPPPKYCQGYRFNVRHFHLAFVHSIFKSLS